MEGEKGKRRDPSCVGDFESNLDMHLPKSAYVNFQVLGFHPKHGISLGKNDHCGGDDM